MSQSRLPDRPFCGMDLRLTAMLGHRCCAETGRRSQKRSCPTVLLYDCGTKENAEGGQNLW
jgi:hypothetical protein